MTDPQRKKIWAMAHKTLGWDDPKMLQQIGIVTGSDVGSIEELTKAQASKVIEDFQAHIDASSGGSDDMEPF